MVDESILGPANASFQRKRDLLLIECFCMVANALSIRSKERSWKKD
jgi:hypothetical protein